MLEENDAEPARGAAGLTRTTAIPRKAKRLEADAPKPTAWSPRPPPKRMRFGLSPSSWDGAPKYVDLVRAKRWNGVLPRIVPGEGVGAFLSMPAPPG